MICENPDCLETCDQRHLEQEAGRHTFTPATAWQKYCSIACRNHHNYLLRTKVKREALKDVE